MVGQELLFSPEGCTEVMALSEDERVLFRSRFVEILKMLEKKAIADKLAEEGDKISGPTIEKLIGNYGGHVTTAYINTLRKSGIPKTRALNEFGKPLGKAGYELQAYIEDGEFPSVEMTMDTVADYAAKLTDEQIETLWGKISLKRMQSKKAEE